MKILDIESFCNLYYNGQLTFGRICLEVEHILNQLAAEGYTIQAVNVPLVVRRGKQDLAVNATIGALLTPDNHYHSAAWIVRPQLLSIFYAGTDQRGYWTLREPGR